MTNISKIGINQIDEFKKLRLEALRLDPKAFGESYENIKDKKSLYWSNEVSNKNTSWFAYKDGKNYIGIAQVKYAMLIKFSHIAKISGVYIRKEYRGKGMGYLFLSELIDRILSNKKITKIKIIANMSQENAIKLYTKIGFKKVGILKREFKIGRNYMDAVQMEFLR